jgi:mycothiol synthase
MDSSAPPGLAIANAQDDADLEAMIAVRTASDPDRPPPRIENLRHMLSTEAGLIYPVALLDGMPVACGFMYPDVPEYAEAHVVVVPEERSRGIGSAMLAEIGALARAAERTELQGEARASDAQSRAFFERRGYRVVGGEQAVALDLEAYEPEPARRLTGVEIVALADHPDLADALYAVGVEGAADIPGNAGTLSIEQWRAMELDRPSRRRDLFFVAVADGEPIGYVSMDDLGREGHNGLTTVRRAWRRRGIATALKRTQVAAAKRAGFVRLVTGSEERNLPMRSLNAKLGYRPDPSRSTIVVRGPANVRFARGDR